MKFFLLFIGLSIQSISSIAQSEKFAGTWHGILHVGSDLRIVFHIAQTENGSLVSKADSPDQYVFGIKCDTAFIKNKEITIELKNLNASFTGKLINDTVITGNFVQQSAIPLTLEKKTKITPEVLIRPQTPQPPFPYKSEDISYTNKDASITFGATITIPQGKGPFPAIVLVSGSGPQNRNGEMLGHQFLAVLADHLTKNGYVVLRYDERGIGKSTGRFSDATTADFAKDASAGVDLSFVKKRS